MEIALHDGDGEHRHTKSKFPNLALMKISAYHKAKGDHVEWWFPFKKYDVVYSSKVFSFTPENPYLPEDTIKGGTGYGLYEKLPPEIDSKYPDYNIYPDCDYAIGFITRGCMRRCDYCVVPKKEGEIRYNAYAEMIVRADTRKIVLMDNNILGSAFGRGELERLATIWDGYFIDVNQGMDIFYINDKVCRLIKLVKWIKYIRFSCDKIEQLPYFEKANVLFQKHGIPASRIFIYLLVREDLANAEFRVQSLHKINKSWTIYAQAERQGNTPPNRAMLEFAQRYVYGRCYKKEAWLEYIERRDLGGFL